MNPRILLIHGGGLGNAGDNGQMLSALERLERIFPNGEIVVGQMYESDDGHLIGKREHSSTPHLFVNRQVWTSHTESESSSSAMHSVRRRFRVRRGRISTHIKKYINSRAHLRRIAEGLLSVVSLFRGGVFLFVLMVYKRLGLRLPLGVTGQKAIDTLISCDAVYCSGGGNLNDIWFHNELIPRVVSYKAAAILDKPLVVSGQGVGPLESKLGKMLLRWSARHALIFGCRDHSNSRDFLIRIGLCGSKVQSFGDDAFDLRNSSNNRVNEIIRQEGIPSGHARLVAVHIRLHNFTQDFTGRGITVLASFLDRLVEEIDCIFAFVPITYARGSRLGDLRDAAAVKKRMRYRERVTLIDMHAYSPPDMKSLIGRCDALIGFSYHAWIFALSNGRPAFGLFDGEYFRLKSRGLYDWYGISNWLWDLNKFDEDEATRIVLQTLADSDSVEAMLHSTNSMIVRQIKTPAKELADALASRGSIS